MPPRLPETAISRRELLARLDEGLSKKLILVTAPTGFGKTTLVASWVADRDFASAWVTLDPNDNDPVRFWTYAITALRTLDASLGKNALAALLTGDAVKFEAGRDLRCYVHGLTSARVIVNDLGGAWEGVIGSGNVTVRLKAGGDVTLVTDQKVEAIPPNYLLGQIERPASSSGSP
jgi:hypothetical protein